MDRETSSYREVENKQSCSKVEGDMFQNESIEWFSNMDKNLWHQLCRLCAKRNDNIIPIYGGEGLEHELGSKLSDIFPFEISESDGLPKYCCDLCASVILSWNDMISYSKIANEKLNNMLSLFLSGNDSVVELIEADHMKIHDAHDNVRESNVVSKVFEVTNMVEVENNDSAKPIGDISAGNETEADNVHLNCNNKIKVLDYEGDVVESNFRPQISEFSDTLGKNNCDSVILNQDDDCNHECRYPALSSDPSDKNNCDSVVHDQNDDYIPDQECSDPALLFHDSQCNVSALDFSNEDLTAVDNRNADGDCTVSEQKRLQGLNKLQLQAYKFHMPLKYITVNGYQFLRTKVFGFEPCSIPDNNMDVTSMFFKCCLCESVVQDINVIAHSKSHYPLKMTDSCKICHFAFGSIKCFRIHLKKHTIFIDEQYRKPASSPKALKLLDENFKNIVEYERSDNLTGLSEEISPLNVSNIETLELLKGSQKQITECSDSLNLLVKPEIFVCEYCGNSYRFKKTLHQHIKRAHFSPFTCKTCKKKFPSKLSLVKHKCVQIVPKKPGSKVKWLNCKCKKIFLFEEQYAEHVKSCEKAKYLPCEQCGREFPDKVKLEMHVFRQHIKLKELKKTSVWMCEICGCHLSAISARKHYITHSFLEKKFSCSICEMKFSGKSALEKHVQSHSDARPFECSICKASFKRKDHLKIHMKNKHNEFVDKKYECRKCKRRFTTQSYLIRHQRLHSQGVSYECAVCRSRYPTEHSLKMHQTRTKHDSIKELSDTSISLNSADWANRFRCSICNRRYGSITSLKKHKSIHHKNAVIEDEVVKEVGSGNENKNVESENNMDIVENVYECSQCHRRYLSEFGLKLHQSRSKHAPTKVIPKKKCKLIGIRKGEKNPRFQCNVCKEMFSSLLSLKMHKIKRKHFSKCPSCDKRFALDFKLRNHLIKVHRRNDIDEKIFEFTPAEIMPYKCEFCEQKFAMEHNYLAHLERKHKNQNETNNINYIYIDSNVFKQEITNGETPIIYHCIECWDNFFTEEEFHNHSHDNKDDVVANTTEFDNIASSQITEPNNLVENTKDLPVIISN